MTEIVLGFGEGGRGGESAGKKEEIKKIKAGLQFSMLRVELI